ncbi:MAG TPA: TonB family protein, partial [Terriglobales bacterium]|nr:TonB family protein [Terriglobales bacterium]
PGSSSLDHSSSAPKRTAPSSSSSTLPNPPASVKQAWELVLEQIISRTGASGAAIALREDDGFDCKATAGSAVSLLALANEDEGIVAECVRTGKIVLSDDSRQDPRMGPAVCQLLNIGSLIIAPLRIDEQVDGLLLISSPRAFAFDAAAMTTITAVATAIELILSDLPKGAEITPQSSAGEIPVASEPSSSPFASAFARAIANSAEPGKQSDAPENQLSAADLFAAAGTFRADEEPSTPESPSAPDAESPSEVSLLPEESNTEVAALVETPALVIDDNAPAETLPDKSVPRQVPPPVVAAAMAHVDVPIPELLPKSTTRRWIVPLVLLLIVVFGSVTFWLTKESTAFRHNVRTEPIAVQHSAPQTSSVITQPETPAPVVPELQPAIREASPVHAHTETSEPKPTDRYTLARTSEPVRKPAALPTPVVVTKPRTDDSPAPPPIAPKASELHSLLVPAVSAVPVLSSGIDVSSVMLPVPRDPNSAFIAARVVTQPLPAYPETARTANREGAVVLLITVNTAGRVSQARVLAGDPMLSAPASAAVQSWLYEPAKVDGRPVESTVRVTLTFHLQR